MLQPKDADIRREPCRIPVGPNRAPGLAVTAYWMSANENYSQPGVLLFYDSNAYMYTGSYSSHIATAVS